ncbi:hypothetical protein [Streptomyces sp. NPDC088789]
MPSTHLTRTDRLALARTALSGIISGIARAFTTWLLDHLSS